MREIEARVELLKDKGNFRVTPEQAGEGLVDLAGNDYLGLAADSSLRADFLERVVAGGCKASMSSSASRLLTSEAEPYNRLEALLAESYGGRPTLLFNSGYHANVGLVSALASGGSTLIVADKLVHASIIDGIVLSRAPFERFRHNDLRHLERILAKNAGRYDRMLIITESVFSMDGDSPDLEALVALKRTVKGAMLYVDEAHAVGVCGPQGLGLSVAADVLGDVDVLVGTFGKALAGEGAFASFASPSLRDFAVNTSRSFIFSTALSPLMVEWMAYLWPLMMSVDDCRERLAHNAAMLADALGVDRPSHIIPYIVGSAEKAVALARQFAARGVRVLPIRVPTVPPGTERLRFSLSAALSPDDMQHVCKVIKEELCN